MNNLALHDWNNNFNGTYRSVFDLDGKRKFTCYLTKNVPNHPQLKSMYDFVYYWAMDNYMCAAGREEATMKALVEKFGEITEDVKDYLISCAYAAGNRAGLLIEEPNHYE